MAKKLKEPDGHAVPPRGKGKKPPLSSKVKGKNPDPEPTLGSKHPDTTGSTGGSGSTVIFLYLFLFII